ncbi:zinc-binding dehydrogenase [Aquiflexum sp. LQ15W]|uniref:quinone oxidoreductase family protein n=1 Tax=Cognataquiflexum nitidum TaxID=2922272 RepID=UPI001F13F520|nr:zinc-binding dehydrogenase [Cognataquiflexum nitidum]MCH6198952.1 zinc-binding dehydrogenase [Cognataquiflexum nitidum]
MKAIILNRTLPEGIETADIRLEALAPDEVKIQIKSAALNHRDEWCRQGKYANLRDGIILGSDAAGIVVEAGQEVDASWLGKEVIINPASDWGENEYVQSKTFKIIGMPDHGTLGEYIQVKSDRIHLKPDHLNWDEAAALPLGAVTAYRALFRQGEIQSTDNVLVTGFGGGVAQFGVQFALSLGAQVYISSSSEEKMQKALNLGCSGAFDYREENWAEKALADTGGFDLILDSAMGDTLNNLIKVTKPGGRIVFYGATRGNASGFESRRIFWNQIKLIGSTMGNDEDFDGMLSFVSKKKIVPIIDQIFNLDDSVKAFEKMKEGKQMGKIVIRVTQ